MGIIKKKEIKLSTGKKYKVSMESYSSTADLVNESRNRKIVNNYEDMQKKQMDEEWHGVKSYDEALDLMKYGYQPTVDRLRVTLSKKVSGEAKRIKFENSVHGFAPIVPLAMKGVPTSMINMTMKPIKCKVIDIYYDNGVHCGYSAEEIIKCGQTLLDTIFDLEKQGYRFNLYTLQGFCNSGDGDILCVKIKDSNKPLDIKRMSFSLTHPAFLRVIGFDWQGKSPAAKYRGCGRGMPLNGALSFKEAQELSKNLFGDNAIYISCGEIKNKKTEHIKEVLTNDHTEKQ